MRCMRGVALFASLILAVCAACVPTLTTDGLFYAPDFTLTALDGTSYTLRDLRGRWVIITFWAITCPPCVEDLPLLQQLTDEAEGKLVVLGVNMRESTETISAFLAPLDVHFPILLSPYDQMLLDYNVIGLPLTLLISPEGEIIDRRFGPIDPESLLATILDTAQ